MDKNSSATNFSYIGIGRIVTIVLQALFYLLFAKLLDPALYGELNVALALAGTFATLSRFGLNYSLQVSQSKKEHEISQQIKTLFLVTTSVASLILIPIDVFIAILCFGSSLFLMSQQDLLGLRKYKNFMSYSILKSVLFFVIPILLYFALEIPGIVLGMAIASIIPSISFFKDFKIKSFSGIRNKSKVLFQNYLIDLSGLSVMIDKLLISYMYGLYSVGVYQFNLQILAALQVIPGVLFSYLISEVSTGETHGKITKLVVLATVGISITVIVISPFFVEMFFPKYIEGVFGLQLMVLTIIPQSIGASLGAKLVARESTKVGYVSLIIIGVLLLLIATLGGVYGFVGLSLAVLISTSIGVILYYVLSKKLKTKNEPNSFSSDL